MNEAKRFIFTTQLHHAEEGYVGDPHLIDVVVTPERLERWKRYSNQVEADEWIAAIDLHEAVNSNTGINLVAFTDSAQELIDELGLSKHLWDMSLGCRAAEIPLDWVWPDAWIDHETTGLVSGGLQVVTEGAVYFEASFATGQIYGSTRLMLDQVTRGSSNRYVFQRFKNRLEKYAAEETA